MLTTQFWHQAEIPSRLAMETEGPPGFLLILFFFQQDVDIGEHVAGQKSNTSRLASMVVHHLNKHPLLCTLFIYSGNDDNMTYKGLLELPTTDIYRMIGQKFSLSFFTELIYILHINYSFLSR